MTGFDFTPTDPPDENGLADSSLAMSWVCWWDEDGYHYYNRVWGGR